MRVWRTLSYCWASLVAFVFGYQIRSEFWISALKLSMLIDCNFRYLAVCGMDRLWLDEICKLTTTEKWSGIKSEAETERTLHLKEQIIRSRAWPWMKSKMAATARQEHILIEKCEEEKRTADLPPPDGLRLRGWEVSKHSPGTYAIHYTANVPWSDRYWLGF